MTRDEFLKLLNTNNHLQILYEFYKKESEKRNKPVLSFYDFRVAMIQWKYFNFYRNKVIEYYYDLFDIRQLTYNNQIIKFL